MVNLKTDVPVILLGGQRNTLAVARNLGRNGVKVLVSGRPTCWGLYTTQCAGRFIIPREASPKDFWRKMLLTDADPALGGAIVFAMNDDALQFLIVHHKELRSRYILDDMDPDLYEALLDKVKTLELARVANMATPKNWITRETSDLHKVAESVQFPVIIKPVHTHRFAQIFGVKLFLAHDAETLLEKAMLAVDRNVPFMIVEMIPGPDTNLKGYYTYITKDGERLFEYTHSVIRRFPPGWGMGCCHHALILPEVVEAGRKFLSGIGFQGFANVEFKKDQSDGQLKVIEVNTRFTAPHELMVRSGMPLDLIVYRYLTGQQVPQYHQVNRNFGSWLPVFDFMAFRQLNKRGEMTFWFWVADVLSRRPVLNVFSWSDPRPILKVITLSLKKSLRRLGRRKT